MTEANKEINQENWFKTNPKKAKLLIVFILLVILEIIIRIFAWTGVYPYQTYPTTHNPVYWDDINEHFGVWRYNNASLRHRSGCFDVTYTSNSYGARDVEREKTAGGKQRIVMLGDSYLEGFGVEDEKRFSNLVEGETGNPCLNFGTSGSFGSIQQWMLYKHLASKFEHNAVAIFHLPYNDFSDNNPNDFPVNRFRPYLKGEKGQYELYYSVEFEKRGKDFRKMSKVIKNMIDNNWYTANFLRWATRMVKKGSGNKHKKLTAPSYESYSEGDMDRLLYSYQQIVKLAGGRKVYIFSIPAHADYVAAKNGKTEFKLHKDLNQFAEVNKQVEYIDLLPALLDYTKKHQLDHEAITLGCDGHWGNLGHKIVAEKVAEIISFKSK